MRGIDEHEPRDVCAVPGGKDPHHQAAERVPDEHERRRDAGALEQHRQLVSHATRRSRHRPGVAPAKAGAIVAAGARQRGDLRLDERPADGGASERRVHDHRRRACS